MPADMFAGFSRQQNVGPQSTCCLSPYLQSRKTVAAKSVLHSLFDFIEGQTSVYRHPWWKLFSFRIFLGGKYKQIIASSALIAIMGCVDFFFTSSFHWGYQGVFAGCLLGRQHVMMRSQKKREPAWFVFYQQGRHNYYMEEFCYRQLLNPCIELVPWEMNYNEFHSFMENLLPFANEFIQEIASDFDFYNFTKMSEAEIELFFVSSCVAVFTQLYFDSRNIPGLEVDWQKQLHKIYSKTKVDDRYFYADSNYSFSIAYPPSQYQFLNIMKLVVHEISHNVFDIVPLRDVQASFDDVFHEVSAYLGVFLWLEKRGFLSSDWLVAHQRNRLDLVNMVFDIFIKLPQKEPACECHDVATNIFYKVFENDIVSAEDILGEIFSGRQTYVRRIRKLRHKFSKMDVFDFYEGQIHCAA